MWMKHYHIITMPATFDLDGINSLTVAAIFVCHVTLPFCLILPSPEQVLATKKFPSLLSYWEEEAA